jgi:hypothetical protein
MCLAAAVPAQVVRERPGVKAPSPPAATGAPACSGDDKIEATALSINPAQPAPGQTATLRLTVKSKCASGTKPLDIQWEITGAGDHKLAGGDARLNPGASSTFTATWAAEAGAHPFRGDAYAQDESTAGTQNNWRGIDVTVQPKLVTKLLDRKSAKEAGADFPANGEATCSYTTSEDGDTSGTEHLIFQLVCGGVLGGKADFEAYSNFTLKNGWKVKSYQISEVKNGSSGWRWVTTPTNGSTSTYSKVHLWANGHATVNVKLTVTIEGPEGTNPYQ